MYMDYAYDVCNWQKNLSCEEPGHMHATHHKIP